MWVRFLGLFYQHEAGEEIKAAKKWTIPKGCLWHELWIIDYRLWSLDYYRWYFRPNRLV